MIRVAVTDPAGSLFTYRRMVDTPDEAAPLLIEAQAEFRADLGYSHELQVLEAETDETSAWRTFTPAPAPVIAVDTPAES